MIDATVNFANGQFTLTISDLATGKTASTTAACAECQRSSAEWNVERPALCNNDLTNCFLTELANFGTATLGGATAAVEGGKAKGPGGFTNFPIFMVDQAEGGGFISLDSTSALSGKQFSVTWIRSGNIVPISLG